MVLEAVGDGAGVGAVVHLEAVSDVVAVEDLVELFSVEAEPIRSADG